MKIKLDNKVKEKLKEIPHYDKFVNSILKKATNEILHDYKSDKKLIEFTVLDGDDFYA